MIGSVGLLVALEMQGGLDLYQALLVLGAVSLAWSMVANLDHWYAWPSSWRSTGLTELFRIGAWSLGNNLCGYLYNRISTWYTLVLLGPTSVAVLELGRQLVTVVQSLIAAMANYWQPILARLVKQVPFAEYLSSMWRIAVSGGPARRTRRSICQNDEGSGGLAFVVVDVGLGAEELA